MNRSIVFLLLFSLSGFATLFKPLPIKQQIMESDSIIQGEVLATESELHENKIVTKLTLSIQRTLDVTENMKVDLYFPGGNLGDQARKVHGAPEFNIGEKVVVFTKDAYGKSWIQNLGLGKYSLKKVGEKFVLVNQIFPGNPDMGQIELKEFISLVERVKKKEFSINFYEKFKHDSKQKLKKGNPSRSIASVSEKTNHYQKDNSTYWLILFLGLIVFIFALLRRKLS